jgi:hypothetical protein
LHRDQSFDEPGGGTMLSIDGGTVETDHVGIRTQCR